MVSRFRLWRLKRKLRHSHDGYSHSHQDPQIDHEHYIDTCCYRPDCWALPLHRVHPRDVLK